MYDHITITPSFSKSLQLSGQIVVKSANLITEKWAIHPFWFKTNLQVAIQWNQTLRNICISIDTWQYHFSRSSLFFKTVN